jgi:hypothetical protein
VEGKMRKVALLINDADQQYEGLRSSLGLLLANAYVQMFVLHQEIDYRDETYLENLELFEEMEGECFSNNQVNVEKYGFKHATIEEMADRLREVDVIIPF